MEYMIEVEKLTKLYSIYDSPGQRLKDALGISHQYHGKDFYALKDVSFKVKPGETLAIIGENGAGKSTLLKLLTGVLTPTSGVFRLNGKVAALLELGTGFNPEYTGVENIYLSGNIMGLSKFDVENRINSILEFADIGDFINQKVKTYSSGMFARLAFSVAIHVNPEILIVDEALAVGDLFFQQKCNRFMKEKMQNCTKLLVTHDMGSVANMADRAIVLSKGMLKFEGKPLDAIEFYTKEAHTEIFGGLHKETQNLSENEPEIIEKKDWTMVRSDALGGALGIKIEGYHITINDHEYQGYVSAEDTVKVSILIQCDDNIDNIIIGYQLKDKYGNTIFGENTVSSGFDGYSLEKGRRYIAEIEFEWPQIQQNTYFLTLGLGDGYDAMQHIIQCWAHNIFEFKNITYLPDHGLFNNKIKNFSFFVSD